MQNEILVKETVVVGTDMRVVLHSIDGWRWYSDKREAEQCAKRREKLLEASRQVNEEKRDLRERQQAMKPGVHLPRVKARSSIQGQLWRSFLPARAPPSDDLDVESDMEGVRHAKTVTS